MPVDPDRDLITGPVDRALKMYREQLASIEEQIVPKPRMRPGTRWLHNRGMLLKDFQK